MRRSGSSRASTSSRSRSDRAGTAIRAFRQALVGAGLSPDYAGLMLALFAAVRQGYAASVSDDVRKLTGHAPRSVAEYARTYRHLFT